MNAIFNKFDDIVTREVAPRFFSKLIHTDTNTINFIEVKAGSAIALHSMFMNSYHL